ncbi:glycosyltransferase family 2 protein [Agromyces archimandritae]|uniref:Glycosyltransferase family 2 protein n=1 Tax=Agromyces archimandritae TaxID=2781962 RepID=A0A975IP60_9MICO|nr:glycosyltransferase family 2 protein [Agromyces archimandritae]QTX05270.1 glycosyltransferase family 2 protein [Agromyces archimandritae]
MVAELSNTLIVIPALNESGSVASVVDEVHRHLPGVRLLVVDDGSTDDTAAVARAAGATVVSLPFNLGVGGAMRVGFNYALEHGLDNVVQVDADGQHNPESVRALVAELDHADLVIGARFAGQGDYEVRGPRRWAMVVLSAALSRIAGAKLSDTTSGFKASGPRAVRLFARHYPAEYLGDTIESLVIATRAGCTVTQVPVSMRPRSAGQPSHHPMKAAIYLGRAAIALAFALMRPAIPLDTSEQQPA